MTPVLQQFRAATVRERLRVVKNPFSCTRGDRDPAPIMRVYRKNPEPRITRITLIFNSNSCYSCDSWFKSVFIHGVIVVPRPDHVRLFGRKSHRETWPRYEHWNFCGDGHNDTNAHYHYLQEKNVIPVIPLQEKSKATYPIFQPTVRRVWMKMAFRYVRVDNRCGTTGTTRSGKPTFTSAGKTLPAETW